MATDQLEEPYTLLSVPKPFGGDRTRSHASSVYRYSAQAAKQRTEIAVAVDGEGVYVYDVVNPRLITSYAVSPQTRFMCKPCSLIRKRSDRLAQRLTYAAIHQKDSKQSSIICFVEDIGKRASDGAGKSATGKEEHIFPGREASISSLIALPRDTAHENAADAFDLALIHEHKTIQCLSGDLRNVHWTFDWPKTRGADVESSFCHAKLSDLKNLRRNLLSNAHEAAVVVDSWGIDENSASIMVLLRTERSKGSDRLRLYASLLRLPNSGRRMVTCDVRELPVPRQIGSKGSTSRLNFQIAPTGNNVFLQVHESLVRWDLNNLQPTAELVCQTGLVTYLSLGHAELIALQSNSCSIVDLEWRTTQAEIFATPASTSSRGAGSKRSRESSLASFLDLEFVDLFYGTGLAIALRSGSLVAVPVASAKSHKRQRTGPRSLAESVGKVVTQGSENLLSNSQSASNKQLHGPFADTVRDFVKENRVADLEEFLAKDLDLSYERVASGNGADDGRNRLYADLEVFLEDQSGRDIVHWTFPKDTSTLIRRTDWAKATLVFDQIFSSTNSERSPIKARFYSPSIYKWLALTGLFTTKRQETTSQVSAGRILLALAAADPTLSLMGEFLSWSFHLDLDYVLHALDLTIESLDSPIDQSRLQIKDTPSEEGRSAGSEDDSLANASRAAEEDLALAIASLNEGTTIRGGLLRSIFDRLSAFEDGAIVKGFNKLLAPRKLVFLINLLRIELADGGWTTRYTDEIYQDEDDVDDEGPADQSIRIIIKLLNAAVDAIGPTGWNVGLSSDKQLNSDEMILVLRAEITAALEGSQEYQAMGAALQDFSRYCAEVEPHGKSRKRRAVDAVHNPGFVHDDTEDAMLPLGARRDRLEMTRTSKGGRVTFKSKGALGQELSMRVGKYSLDKIRV
ncbi:hypothetical protein K461DRAFT_317128 [Myriangium duriaei CBS 260.36]|uniref:Uncharacterized protein n=1 Tax=Myriangium duriaei CBS 260.36 TaxID=1168546 RepID=A0A9P4J8L8_9PEZI|nr:hypothetical protein K461DRAFT_317128 [Myriangium duriaei CBS 260.36]